MKLKKVLEEINPYVYVVGSYARGTQNSSSDIDLYIKRRSDKELIEDGYYDGICEEHYIDKIIQVFEKYNVSWDSVIIGHINSETLPIMIEASYLYKVNEESNLKTHSVNVFGVKMTATLDEHN